ncbi:MAG: hypothetical protein JWR10_4849 [Rubritepida sp.]|nr:hypothetical protein [Rubritepida sp.]
MGPMNIVVSALIAVLLTTNLAVAQTPVTERLAGEVLFGGATLVDPPPGEAAGTHAYLTITGAAARRMFNAMSGPIRGDSCQAGWRTKRAGSLTCSLGRRASEAQCDLAVLLARGELAPGRPC